MATDKKGFVLYFDMVSNLTCLSAEQRGHLLSAAMEYAQRVAERETAVEEVMADYPELLPETQMALRFISDTILRDTRKWQTRQKNCQRAAQERKERAAAAARWDDVPNLPL